MRKAFGALFGDGDEEDNDQPASWNLWTQISWQRKLLWTRP